MATEERTHGPATRVAIRNLNRLKPEHQDLLRTLLADGGMGKGTLETLVEHLLEEEDPSLTRAIAAVRAGDAGLAPDTAPSQPSPQSTGMSVGSLRNESAAARAPATRGTVGDLRSK
jgi:hypothetical protein